MSWRFKSMGTSLQLATACFFRILSPMSHPTFRVSSWKEPCLSSLGSTYSSLPTSNKFLVSFSTIVRVLTMRMQFPTIPVICNEQLPCLGAFLRVMDLSKDELVSL
ncbi:hypothetical protein D5086_018570 [Populus alba]|uniref:Uncharacterized protein n=1 Tax=Populus alba TaxID=43335 RepID=A0ACC4BQR3_POPAL